MSIKVEILGDDSKVDVCNGRMLINQCNVFVDGNPFKFVDDVTMISCYIEEKKKESEKVGTIMIGKKGFAVHTVENKMVYIIEADYIELVMGTYLLKNKEGKTVSIFLQKDVTKIIPH